MILGLVSLAQIHLNRIYRKESTWRYSIVLVVGFIVTVWMGMKYGIDKEYQEEISRDRYEALLKEKGESSEAHRLFTESRFFLRIDNVPYQVSEDIYSVSTLGENQKEKREICIIERRNFFYAVIFERMYVPLQATMFSLLAFFMASAAYRAFRAKSLEASLLLISAFLVMLGRVPIGEVLGSAIGFFLGFVPYLNTFDYSKMFTEISQFIMDCPNSAGQRAIMIGAALGIVSASLRIWIGIEREHLGRD